MFMLKFLKNMKRKQLLLLLSLTVVSAVGVYMYMKKNEGFDVVGHEEGAVLYFFYVDWCPHCTTAKPEVAKLEEDLANNNNLMGNTPVNVKQVNCEEEVELAKKFNVKSYPTVVAVKDNKKEELNNKVTFSNLKDFLSRLVN